MSEKKFIETIEKLKNDEIDVLNLFYGDNFKIDSDVKRFEQFLINLESNASVREIVLLESPCENEENFIKLFIALGHRYSHIKSLDIGEISLSENSAEILLNFLKKNRTLLRFCISNFTVDVNDLCATQIENLLFTELPKIILNNLDLKTIAICTNHVTPSRNQTSHLFNSLLNCKIKNFTLHSPIKISQNIGEIIGDAIPKMHHLSNFGISIHENDAEAVIDGISKNDNIITTYLRYGGQVKPLLVEKFAQMLVSSYNIINSSIEPSQNLAKPCRTSNYDEALRLAKVFSTHSQLDIPLDYATIQKIEQRKAAVKFLLEHEVRPAVLAAPAPPVTHEARLAERREASSSSWSLGV